MLASTSATTLGAARTDGVSAMAMTPLVLWTAFAVLLSEEVWRRN
jgi:benzodiazapine receptor